MTLLRAPAGVNRVVYRGLVYVPDVNGAVDVPPPFDDLLGAGFSLYISTSKRVTLPRAVGNVGHVRTLNQPLSYTTAANPSVFNTTWCKYITLETGFVAISIPVVNAEPTPVTISRVIIGPTVDGPSINTPGTNASLEYNLNPVGGFQAALFSGSESVTVPPGTPANPTIIWSDWVIVSNFLRADGTPYPGLAIRAYYGTASVVYPAGGGVASYTTFVATDPSFNAFETPADGRVDVTRSRVGDWTDVAVRDLVGTPGGIFASSPIQGVRFISAKPLLTIWAVGDSTTYSGSGARPALAGWAHKLATSHSTPHKPVVLYNSGYNGQRPDQWYPRIESEGAYFPPGGMPNVMICQAFSSNGAFPLTQARVDSDKYYVGRMIDFCARNGIYLILRTAGPTGNAATSGSFILPADQLARKKAFNVWLLSLGDSGLCKVADTSTALTLTLPSGLEQFNEADTDDGIHNNNNADGKIQAALDPFIADVVASY